jgi:hypothetical protein
MFLRSSVNAVLVEALSQADSGSLPRGVRNDEMSRRFDEVGRCEQSILHASFRGHRGSSDGTRSLRLNDSSLEAGYSLHPRIKSGAGSAFAVRVPSLQADHGIMKKGEGMALRQARCIRR